jgi:hypothetical protein
LRTGRRPPIINVLKGENLMKVHAVGIGWYSREDYPRILEIMKDADKLPRTYDEFLKRYKTAETMAKSQDNIVVRAVIKPEEFLAWCGIRGLNVDAQARMQFGNEIAARELGQIK